MKRINTWIAAPVLALAASHSVAAGAEDIAGPYSLRAGGSTDVDAGSRYGLGVGVSRNLGPGRVDIDFSHQSRHGNRTQTTGLSYVHTMNFGSAAVFYGGLGVGVYHVSVKNGASGAAIDDDRISLGGKVLLGFNITRRMFVEAAFTKVSKVSGMDASNFVVQLGVRF
jgi:hypothetical protein